MTSENTPAEPEKKARPLHPACVECGLRTMDHREECVVGLLRAMRDDLEDLEDSDAVSDDLQCRLAELRDDVESAIEHRRDDLSSPADDDGGPTVHRGRCAQCGTTVISANNSADASPTRCEGHS